MALPIFVAVERIDPRLLEAARNLGAGPFRGFLAVTLPLSLPGLAAGCILTFILAFGAYVTPVLLGSPRNQMVANAIVQAINVDAQQRVGLIASLRTPGAADVLIGAVPGDTLDLSAAPDMTLTLDPNLTTHIVTVLQPGQTGADIDDGDRFTIECPTGSGRRMNLYEVAEEISRRLASIFLRDATGRRPVYGGARKFQEDPHWRDLILFYEYFHGDNGAGLGASHQTGWTGLVARAMHLFATSTSAEFLELGKAASVLETEPVRRERVASAAPARRP